MSIDVSTTCLSEHLKWRFVRQKAGIYVTLWCTIWANISANQKTNVCVKHATSTWKFWCKIVHSVDMSFATVICLAAKQLDLYQVLAPNAYSYKEEFIPVIKKAVQSQVHEVSVGAKCLLLQGGVHSGHQEGRPVSGPWGKCWRQMPTPTRRSSSRSSRRPSSLRSMR